MTLLICPLSTQSQEIVNHRLLEILLALFAIRTLLQSHTCADNDEKHFIPLCEKAYTDPRSMPQEVDELVDKWIPEPLGAPLTAEEQSDLASVPVVSVANGPRPKVANIEARSQSCQLQLHEPRQQRSYQRFSTIPCVISALEKRGDTIVADRGINFAIQKGLQISRSTIRWFDHDKNLEDMVLSIEKERRKHPRVMDWYQTTHQTRTDAVGSRTISQKTTHRVRFLVVQLRSGEMVDLPKLIEFKYKYKYRLIFDESISFDTVGRTGRGLMELYNVPATQIDMIIGSVSNGLNLSGGFCAGSRIVVDHQHINSTSFVFSAAVPALLAVSASEGINILRNMPSILSTLQENVRAIQANLDRVEAITIPSHAASPIIHIHRGDRGRDARTWRVDRRLRGQELVEARPSIRLTITAALSRKERERAAGVIKAAVVKVLTKRK
ncbi:serine palmitoyltransferase [Lactarius vividus]|nr:serine palmitoyltransferase [Lactarius vividus]